MTISQTGEVRREVVRTGRGPSFFNPSVITQWVVIVAAIVLIAMPIAPILYQALLDRALYEAGGVLTLDNIVGIFSDASFIRAAWNSLQFAVLATILSVALGVFIAVLVGRTNVRGKWLLGTLVVWPLFVSDLVKAMGWSIMYGPAGYLTVMARDAGLPTWNLATIAGMALVGGISLAPLTFLYCISAVKSIDPSLENAARTAGAKPSTILFSIVLPLMRPAILTSMFFNFILGLEMLSIPLIFGKPSEIFFFTTYIYMNSVQAVKQDYGQVGAAALVLLAILLMTFAIQRYMMGDVRRFVTIGGKATRQMEFDLGRLRWPVTIVTGLFMFAVVAVPLIGILLQSFAQFFTTLVPYFDLVTLDNYFYVLTEPLYVRALTNSMIISIFGAAIATVFVFMVSAIVTRSNHPLRKFLEGLIMLPRAIPGMIAGLGIFYASVLFPPLGWTRGTIVILIFAFIMRYLPVGYGALMPSMIQVDGELDRSARIAGASWLRTITSIVAPILKPAMLAAYAVFFLRFLKDYSTAVFLFTPGTVVLGSAMLQLIWEGDTGPVAALAVIQIGIAGAFLLLLRLLGKVEIHG